MAITLDATSSYGEESFETDGSISWSHTCSASADILVVVTNTEDSAANDRDIASVTYNGSNLTKAADTSNGDFNTEIWYIVNPSSGANNIVITTTNASITSAMTGGAVSLIGVDTGDPLDATATDTGNGTDMDVALTTISDNTFVVGGFTSDNFVNTFTPDAGQTEFHDGSSSTHGAYGSYDTQPTAGSITIGYTISGTEQWTAVAASFNQSSGGGLSVSASDNISVAEQTTQQSTLFIDTSEAVGVSEYASTVIYPHHVMVNDSLVVSESTSLSIASAPSLNINIFDTLTLAEDASITNSSYVDASDSITITESTASSFELHITTHDEITLADTLPEYHPESIAVTDSTSATIETTTSMDVSNTISITEQSSVFIPTITTSAQDSITITESVTTTPSSTLLSINLSESISITDHLPSYHSEEIFITDSSTVEVLSATVVREIGLSDTLTITEYIDVLENQLNPSTNDIATISENVSISIGANISSSDSIAMSDSCQAQPGVLSISASETISTIEQIDISKLILVSVYEDVLLTDSANAAQAGTLNVSASDTFGQTIPKLIIVDGGLAMRVGGKYHVSI